jgi:hypothetical protein
MDSKWIAWRISFLSAFILSMMVNINYGASLVSSLLSTPVKTIRTTRDLIDSSLQFAAEDISYSVPYFAVSYDALYHTTEALIAQLVRILPAFHETRKLITVFATARYRPPSSDLLSYITLNYITTNTLQSGITSTNIWLRVWSNGALLWIRQ